MLINAIVSIVAIAGLVYLERCLLQHGIDGTIAMLTVTAIAGIAGFNVQKTVTYLSGKKEGEKK